MEFQSFSAGGVIAEGVGAAKFGTITHLVQYTGAEEEGRENRPNEEANWRSPGEQDRGRAGWERHGTGRAAASSESGVAEGDGGGVDEGIAQPRVTSPAGSNTQPPANLPCRVSGFVQWVLSDVVDSLL